MSPFAEEESEIHVFKLREVTNLFEISKHCENLTRAMNPMPRKIHVLKNYNANIIHMHTYIHM